MIKMSTKTERQFELRAKRRAEGVCVYCGRPAVIKQDGTTARRCAKCTQAHLKQKADAKVDKPLESRVPLKREYKKKLTQKAVYAILNRCKKAV